MQAIPKAAILAEGAPAREGRAPPKWQRELKRSFKTQAPDGLWLVVYNAGFQKCGALHSWGPGVRDHYLLHHIVSGKGVFCREGETFSLTAGEGFLVRPGEQVFYAADRDDPWEYCWAGFAGEGAARLLARSEFAGGQAVLRRPAPGLRQGLLDVYKARSSDLASSVRMSGYLQAALGLLIGGGGAAPGEDYAQRGARYLEYNYAQPVTIGEAARQAGVSRSQLYRGFLSRFGCSPREYLSQLRLAAAARLLRRGDLPVGAVARSCGFDDPLYFSRFFRREMGLSPADYRKNFENGN